MNKSQLIDLISKKTQITKTDSELLLDATLSIIKKSVKKGEDVKLVGFGTFSSSMHKERIIKNPKTGIPVHIPAGRAPKFRPGKEFKEAFK